MIGLDNQFLIQQAVINKLYLPLKLIAITFVLYIPFRIKVLSLSGYFGSITMGALIVLFGNIVQFILIALFFVLSSSLKHILKNIPQENQKIPIVIFYKLFAMAESL